MRRVLAVPAARTYLFGQTVSLLGDSTLWLATSVWVKTLTGSNAAAGLVFFCFTGPALLGPLAGALVDRFPRRALLIWANAGAAAAVLPLLAVDGPGRVWLVYLSMALCGAAYTLLTPAQSALLVSIVPGDLLADANGLLRTAQETLRLVGPLLGAGLFVVAGPKVAVLVDAASYAVPIACLLRLKVSEPRARPIAGEGGGLRFIARSPRLRPVVLAAACALCVFGFSETTVFAVAGQGLHRSPAFVGVLAAVQGAGALVGGPSAAPLVRRLGEARLMATGMLFGAAGALLQAVPAHAAVLPGAALFGISLPWLAVGFTTRLQRATPARLQGRVFAAATMAVTVPQTGSIALGAALIAGAGYQALLAAIAVVLVACAVYLFVQRAERPAAARPPSGLPSEVSP
ncbi:MFS transporter [Dactylosporangium vinaceum]|uniref:MFS transporter n=1 Tax=Dactylosporangium vinaceum TaxID=53362 RepID=A0ABV5MHK0_9ACTN|nr:MFS transporter [Dactylosporangium vinaceum]UAB94781.1 MFS transporter [Dactylosporangium vinaceum]